MKSLNLSWFFMVLALVHVLHVPVSVSQLPRSETRILFQVQRFLEYQEPLQGWSNWTNFCYLPSSQSLKIVCFNNHVSELTIIGSKSLKSQSLSEKFSIDSLFTVLTKLSSLKVLSLVSLGLWGPFPAKINRLSSLEVLNISSNFIYGEIPRGIVSMKNLRSLVLERNLLNGSGPDFRGLVSLEEVNLVGNNVGPAFPSLSNNLVSIKLSSNSFRSVVPRGIQSFDKLQEFDVSSNKLIGPFPSFLFSLRSIRYLNLSGNQLSGALPGNTTCSSRLRVVDVSRNLLIGKLPSCVGNSANRTVVSNWNCLVSSNSRYQHPYSFCHKEALAVKPPAKVKKHESTIKLGVVVGLIGGAVGVIAVVALLVLVIVRRSKSRDVDEFRYEASLADKISVRSGSMVGNSVRTIDSRRVPQTMRSAAIGLPQYRVFSLEDIEDATNNFDQMNFVGEVDQGQLYKGWLRDGSLVMIKCIKLKQKNSPQSLVQHMEVLSKLRHLHLVSVLGHCIVTYQDQPSTTASTVFIVFEHISNGSLLDYLSDWRKKEILKWPQRMAITIGVARGIQFLHTGVAPGIFGNNVKIEHVLLDESLTSKLSNYTIPLPTKIGSESPLHRQDNHNSKNTEKEDVYQLGVILLQVITGQLLKSPSQLDELKAQLQQSMTEGASKLRAMMDPSTRGTYAYESLRNTVDITLNCLSKDARNRPSVEDVLWNLQYSNQVQEGWAGSGRLSTQMSF